MAQAKPPKKSAKAADGQTSEDEIPAPRRGRSAPVASDSAALLATAFARKGFADPALVLRWSEIAGAELARIAVPVKLTDGPDGGTLTLKAEPGAALFLAHETRALCDRINAWAGRQLVSKLRFVQGPLANRAPEPARPRPKSLPPSDPAQNFQGQEALREALLSLGRWRRD